MSVQYYIDDIERDWDKKEIVVRGWIFDDSEILNNLIAIIEGYTEIECKYGISRPDVATAFTTPHGNYSGFICRIPFIANIDDYYILTVVQRNHNADRTLFSIRIPSYIDEFTPLKKTQCENLIHYDDYKPVFIFGSARSGTTVMINVLRDCLNIPGYNEGHVFTFLNGIIKKIMDDYEYRLQSMYESHEKGLLFEDEGNNPDNAFYHLSTTNIINNIIKGMVENLYNTHHEWVDKTPGYEAITVVPLLAMVFPKARFVFLHRHPLEVLRSAQLKFPYLKEDQFVINWNQCIRNWEKVRTGLHANQFIEIPQRELHDLSSKICLKLKNLLSINKTELNKIRNYLKTHHPQKTSHFVRTDDIKLSDLSLDEKTKEIIINSSLPIAENWGYEII